MIEDDGEGFAQPDGRRARSASSACASGWTCSAARSGGRAWGSLHLPAAYRGTASESRHLLAQEAPEAGRGDFMTVLFATHHWQIAPIGPSCA